MTAVFAEPVERVVRTVGDAFNTGTVFAGKDDIRAVLSAVDCGLCRLVENAQHPFRLRDDDWNVTLGIELTNNGLEYLGIDPSQYRKPH